MKRRRIDSASLRQNVQRAVNRGESYHQLRRTISYANYGKLRFGTEYEQHLWSECSRLIANCIEFRKQPEPVNVEEIVRELAEIRIGTETPLAA